MSDWDKAHVRYMRTLLVHLENAAADLDYMPGKQLVAFQVKQLERELGYYEKRATKEWGAR